MSFDNSKNGSIFRSKSKPTIPSDRQQWRTQGRSTNFVPFTYQNQNCIPNFNVPGSCYSYNVPFPYFQEGPMSLPAYPTMHPYSSQTIQCQSKKQYKKNVLQSGSSDYMSLPVVNGDENENNHDKRRFSDPGLPCDSDSSSDSNEKQLLTNLIKELEFLKENNHKLAAEVVELKMEVNNLKQQNHLKYCDHEYEPGMLAEIIKEIRDAARVREDALLSKIKHLIEEKQFSMTQLHLVSEKNRHNDRLSKLEEQMKNLSSNYSNSSRNDASLREDASNVNPSKQVLELEREALTLRRELQEARTKKEESDQKLFQLDKKLSSVMLQSSLSDVSDEPKGSSSCTDLISLGSVQCPPQKVKLTGPVTEL